jgi:hypothetical protein
MVLIFLLKLFSCASVSEKTLIHSVHKSMELLCVYANILIVWHFEIPHDVSNCLIKLSQENSAVCTPILYLFNSYVLKLVLPVSCVMAFKVFDKHLVYPISCRWITTCITHRASSTIQVLTHYHRNLPNTLKINAEWN